MYDNLRVRATSDVEDIDLQLMVVGENPLNRNGDTSARCDIVSSSREILEKFIRELRRVATFVKIMTITFGSILLMKIRKVKKDADDVTLAIPSAILPGLNADFDGDVLNTMSLTMEELWDLLAGFSPVNMLINRTDETIKYDVSPLENITLAILSDK